MTKAQLELELREAHETIESWKEFEKEARAIIEQSYEANRVLRQKLEAAESAIVAPIDVRLTCPECGALHVDEGAFATKMHHTHACQTCGLVWRPAVVATRGVRFLPGFRGEVPATVEAPAPAPTPGFCPLSVPFGQGTQKCACHGVGTNSLRNAR